MQCITTTLTNELGNKNANLLLRISRKGDSWAISNVSESFDGGLADLIIHFGSTFYI